MSLIFEAGWFCCIYAVPGLYLKFEEPEMASPVKVVAFNYFKMRAALFIIYYSVSWSFKVRAHSSRF